MAAVSSIVLGAAIAGTAATAYGSYQQYQGSKSQNSAQQQQIQAEQRAEALRKRQMELDARRRSMEMIRNQQRARAIALTNANAQGAIGGSGLQGGYGQIAGQTGVNLLGVSQNLQFGQQMFGINQDISNARMAYANAGTSMAYGRGITGLGQQITSNLGTIGSLSAGFGSASPWVNGIPSGQGLGGYGGSY